MNTAEIRSAFLSFFAEREHRVVPSSSLVPANDPTLLFTNAGMNQFKDALLGREDLGYRRAATAQRCVRAGGKHNDLENVGYTARHHTFFEMLGNFSFGDYFKEETIGWAWDLVTDVFGIPVEKLWVTVHPSDDESRAIWEKKIGVPRDRVISLEENFWAMGDTGPCGPCSELFYDHGPDVAGGPPGSPDEDGDRYIEFWNLVFPQYDRQPDGELDLLPQPGVDTGMGLERIAAILQGVHSNYEIDAFRSLLGAAGSLAGINDLHESIANASVRVISDHIRSSAFLIADGILPGNEDRSYVLRRIVRRALRHGYKLGIREPFFHKLVKPLADEMGEAYPEIVEQQADVAKVLLREEEKFAETLGHGMALLNQTIEDLKGNEIPGDVVFQLYDTFGFPTDLTADVARERQLSVDMDGFGRAMKAQQERSKASARFSTNVAQRIYTEGKVEFSGYELAEQQSTVLGVFDAEGQPSDTLVAGEDGIVVLDRTPFYAESGGQVGDTGVVQDEGLNFQVTDTRPGGDQHLHIGSVAAGSVRVGQQVTARIDGRRRHDIVLNHSATHLMHAALRDELGSHVQQKGSLVAPDRLRFDFSHPEPVTRDQLRRVEAAVNAKIQDNSEVLAEVLGYDDAIDRGAMALFGEKYGDQVRVLTMGDGYSVELCGGTHVGRTGDIGVFRMIGETGVAAGVRRIEAVTGRGALDWIDEGEQTLLALGDLVKSGRGDLEEKVAALLEENRRLARALEQATEKLASAAGSDVAERAVDVNGVKVIAAQLEGDPKAMLQTLDALKSKLGSCVVVLGNVTSGKANLIVGVSKDLTDRITAPDILDVVGSEAGARGGGRPDMARAGGGDPDALAAALDGVADLVAERLA